MDFYQHTRRELDSMKYGDLFELLWQLTDGAPPPEVPAYGEGFENYDENGAEVKPTDSEVEEARRSLVDRLFDMEFSEALWRAETVEEVRAVRPSDAEDDRPALDVHRAGLWIGGA